MPKPLLSLLTTRATLKIRGVQHEFARPIYTDDKAGYYVAFTRHSFFEGVIGSVLKRHQNAKNAASNRPGAPNS